MRGVPPGESTGRLPKAPIDMNSAESPADFSRVPVIDAAPLVAGLPERAEVARQIHEACRASGFFYIVGHGVDPDLILRLERLSRDFFDKSATEKLSIQMSKGGRAWRGYFAVGDELTSGRPDQKEGLYFGSELPDDHPDVVAGTPMHGRNLFPEIPGFREAALEYIAAMTRLGHAMAAGLSLSLGLHERYIHDRYTADPLVLFRIFNYPRPSAPPEDADAPWGVGEHTDYGLLTILWQDEAGGLQVKSRRRWIEAPPIPGAFLCNIGDMLDRLTRGAYRSTPHRVRNRSTRDRLSFAFFFDPNFHAEIHPIEGLLSLIHI